ncbi:MAG TPA: hypothetical protein DCL96_02955 [Prevotella sp.]|uniref:Uncharacterized protein n=1 Tax=Segatella copri TaxID=165179 RepID=A0AA92U2C6_9BACT|nr:hypothetical protein DWV60_12750 [Segatella copri]HAH90679.1 hypothetical protein [Prevotella sp.]
MDFIQLFLAMTELKPSIWLKKKKLDSPGKETPTLLYFQYSLWGTLLRYPIEITMRIMIWESYTGCI